MISAGLRVGAVRPFVAPACTIGRPGARKIAVIRAASKPETTSDELISKMMLGLPALMAPLLLDTSAALAINREYGIVEGQIFSLIHPAIMFFLFGSSVYAGYLGFQWRRTRELAEEIKGLKTQKAPAAVGPDGQPISAPPSPLDQQISELEKVRFI